MLKRAQKKLSQQFNRRSWIFILLFIFFSAGVALGCNNFSMTEENISAIRTYFDGNADFKGVVNDSFFKNFKLMMWLLASGLSMVGIPLTLYFIFTKGVTLGGAVCALLSSSSSHIFDVILCLIPCNMLFITAMMLLSYRSFVFSGTLCRNVLGIKRRWNSADNGLLSLAVTFLISVFLCYLSSLCEAFFIPDL